MNGCRLQWGECRRKEDAGERPSSAIAVDLGTHDRQDLNFPRPKVSWQSDEEFSRVPLPPTRSRNSPLLFTFDLRPTCCTITSPPPLLEEFACARLSCIQELRPFSFFFAPLENLYPSAAIAASYSSCLKTLDCLVSNALARYGIYHRCRKLVYWLTRNEDAWKCSELFVYPSACVCHEAYQLYWLQ